MLEACPELRGQCQDGNNEHHNSFILPGPLQHSLQQKDQLFLKTKQSTSFFFLS